MTDEEREPRAEGFLERWSRVKSTAREAQGETAPMTPVPAAEAPPELPPVDALTFDSDFRGFFHPKVEEGVRRAALRRLFSAPHFNVMDGLDVYIDDYSKSEPIPAAMLAGLKQAQRILQWAENVEEKAEKPVLEPNETVAQDASAVAAPLQIADSAPELPCEAPMSARPAAAEKS